MTTPRHIELWNQCLAMLRDILPEEQYNVWFKDITSHSFDADCLTLVVPSQYFAEHIEDRYAKVLEPILRKVYGPNFKLTYNYFQIKGQPDTVISQDSTRPSPVITQLKNAQPANPFISKQAANIDPQLNPRYNFENYCEGESNKIARAIGVSIAENPKNLTFNPLFIFGQTGVGKTHLIQAIGIRIKENNPSSRVLYVTSRLFESQYTAAVAQKATNSFFHFYQSIDTLIIDDIQDLQGKPGTQNTFYYIFNHLHQNNKQIIMSSDCPPASMDGFETRLLSRFKWGMAAELSLPDLDLRRRVLVQKARQNGLDIPADVIEYIATSVTDSIRDLEGIVVSLIAHAIVSGGNIDLPLARSVVERAVKASRKPINFEVIADQVCTHYSIAPDMLFAKTRKREVSDARQVVMYLAKKIAKMSIVAIGHRLDRTHATVNYAINQIENRLAIDKQLQSDIAKIQATIIG